MINPSRCYGHFSGMGLAQEKADELAKKHNKTFLVYARNSADQSHPWMVYVDTEYEDSPYILAGVWSVWSEHRP